MPRIFSPSDGTVEDPEEILDGSRSVSLEEITGEEAGIIVDNEDDGFEIKRVETGLLGRLLPWKRDECAGHGYVGLARNDSPRRWTFVVDRAFYGGIVRSACVIRAGHGERGVSWNATLPRSGRYDVYAYLPRMRVGIGISDPFMYDKPYRYLLAHGEGTTDVEIVPYRRDDGWILLGRYFFSMGPARVELSDESTRGPIIADAVKWVPVDDVTR